MSRFKVRFKLQGLELEIEGSREDAPFIAEQVAAQVAALIEPAARIIEGQAVDRGQEAAATTQPTANGGSARRRPRQRKFAPGNPAQTGASSPIDWAHDVEKWGTAQQSWNTSKKSMWLIYVI